MTAPLPSVEISERAGLLAWPGLEVDWDGGWVRRATNGYTKRANSLQCLDPEDGERAAERLAEAMAWLDARGLPPVVRTTPLESPALTKAMDDAGWRTIDLSHFYAMPIQPVEADEDGLVLDILDPVFIAAQQRLQQQSAETTDKMRALLGAMSVEAAGIVIRRKGEAVASGLVAIADGIAMTGNVITDPNLRRQGLGEAMMRTGLAWSAQRGAKVAALNVQADNVAAMALYQRLGYSRQYDYLYRVPGK